jgi:hypothetical protein
MRRFFSLPSNLHSHTDKLLLWRGDGAPSINKTFAALIVQDEDLLVCIMLEARRRAQLASSAVQEVPIEVPFGLAATA